MYPELGMRIDVIAQRLITGAEGKSAPDVDPFRDGTMDKRRQKHHPHFPPG